MKPESHVTPVRHDKQPQILRRRLQSGLVASVLAFGVLLLLPASSLAGELTPQEAFHLSYEQSGTAAKVPSIIVGNGQLAAVRGRGTGSVALTVPGTNAPSIVLWDEGIRPVTTANSGTNGNLQSNVLNGGMR